MSALVLLTLAGALTFLGVRLALTAYRRGDDTGTALALTAALLAMAAAVALALS